MRLAMSATITPAVNPIATGLQAVGQQQPDDVRPARADGDAEADFAPPLTRHERGDPVDTDGREGERERSDVTRDCGERSRPVQLALQPILDEHRLGAHARVAPKDVM